MVAVETGPQRVWWLSRWDRQCGGRRDGPEADSTRLLDHLTSGSFTVNTIVYCTALLSNFHNPFFIVNIPPRASTVSLNLRLRYHSGAWLYSE